MIAQSNTFTLSRVLDAPLSLVWQVHTDPQHLAHWWGPAGSKMNITQLDLRPGGICHFHLQMPDGEMWAKFVYREVVPEQKLVFVLSFANAGGDIVPAPMTDVWPREILYTFTFEEQDGKTLVSISGHPIHASESEEKAFYEELAGMSEGFGGSYAQLATYLERVR